nr:U-box domain-containing protein 45-like [Tanacetum cinerariifolium]
MENSEIEENLFALGEPKLHGEMCKTLSLIYVRVLSVFPELENARPRSTSGIQALCSLHIALEKAKTVLQHCAECSKIYLAITGDSVVMKFEKARSALEDGLRRVEDIVPQTIGCQISNILHELEGIEFSLDPIEKQTGDEIIGLLRQGKNFNSNNNDNNELETFHQAASKLGITSSRAALRERRALKKLIEKARVEEDKRKESIVAYLLHLMRKYSKLFRSDFSDDNDSQGSTPCSPTLHGSPFEVLSGTHTFERQLSKLNSFNFKPNFRRFSGQVPVSIPPEELRCPISLQLMYDPVIIASGQTYERICIEKWFSDGHNTCPKSQQQLAHLGLTPNYCVKGLVASWCEQNGVMVPDGPPESLDLNYWRLSLSESESVNSKSLESIGSFKYKGMNMKVAPFPLEESDIIEENEGDEIEGEVDQENNVFEMYDKFLMVLQTEDNLRKKCRVVEKIRRLLKDDEEARIYMGANGFVELLIRFLECGLCEENEFAQESGAMALFNLAVNNNRNKEMMLSAGILSLLVQMIQGSKSVNAAIALYLNLACLDQAKPIIGSSEAVPFLIEVLNGNFDSQCKTDSLHTLYHLSSYHSNIPRLISCGTITALQPFLTDSDNNSWTEKAIAVLINLSVTNTGRDEIIACPGLVTGLSMLLDMGEPEVQEQAAACLLILCTGSHKCCEMVLQEGVIPSLVSISVNGTMRGKQKAQKLLMVFREQRQRDPPVVAQVGPQRCEEVKTVLSKSTSRRKMSRAWSFWRKNKTFSVYQC